jgi:hypothetical protein
MASSLLLSTGFCDSNSIAKNYLRFSLPAEALAQAGSTEA